MRLRDIVFKPEDILCSGYDSINLPSKPITSIQEFTHVTRSENDSILKEDLLCAVGSLLVHIREHCYLNEEDVPKLFTHTLYRDEDHLFSLVELYRDYIYKRTCGNVRIEVFNTDVLFFVYGNRCYCIHAESDSAEEFIKQCKLVKSNKYLYEY